jgi:NDP-sugar pyrophosphorylase family protein
MKPTLVIMAAGIGSRYGGLKQIDPVGPSGEIVLDYSVYDAIRAGFGKVVFIIRPDIETDFKEAIGTKLEGQIDIEYVFQTLEKIPEKVPMFGNIPADRTKPWGTGQAVLMAKEVVKEPFAVINADDFYGRETFEVIGERLAATEVDSTDFSMVGFYIKNTLSANGSVARGYCDVQDGKLATVTEYFEIERGEDGIIRHAGGEMNDNDMVSMNTWGFTPRLFEYLAEGFAEFLQREGNELKSEYLLPEVVDGLIKSGEATVDVLPSNEKWMGVTYPGDKPQVMAGIRALVAAGIYPGCLWA